MPPRTGADRAEIRRHNLGAVLEHLHRSGEASRAELTSLLGLNRSTTAALVADLAGRGLVEETDPARPAPRTAGRPSPVVRVLPARAVALAVEVEVDNVSVALVGIGGRVLARAQAAYPHGAPDPEQAVASAVTLAGPLLGGLGSASMLAGVGVGVAGVVRRDGWVHHAPNLGWREVPLGRLVATGLGFDVPVSVGNDANLGAIAEHARGAGRATPDLAYVSSEVGVGVGVLAGGRPLTGADGYFGEFGHLPLFPRGRQCRCGALGCWETEVGTHALLRRVGRGAEEGRDGVRAVLAAAAAGERAALAAIQYVAERVGLGLGAVVNALNPRLIVLGGFFAELWPLAGRSITAGMHNHALAAAVERVTIEPALLGDDAALLGAAEIVLAEVVADPTLVPTAC
jgi:predicted NBD/HSP70 family sugar kinase